MQIQSTQILEKCALIKIRHLTIHVWAVLTPKARLNSRCFGDFWAAQCSPQISKPAELILLHSLLAFTLCFVFSIFKRSHEDVDTSKSYISESYPSALHIRKFRNPTSPKGQKVGDMSACSALLSGSNIRHNMNPSHFSTSCISI